MSRPSRDAPSLPEWAALGLLCEAPSHGWAIAQSLAPDGEIGRVYSCARPLVYRALGQLRDAGLAEVRGTAASDVRPGPDDARRDAARPVGVRPLARPPGRARSRPAVGADAEAALLRPRRSRRRPRSCGRRRRLLAGTDRALEFSCESVDGFDRTLAALAAVDRPRRALVRRRAARQPDGRTRRLPADRLRQLAPHRARRHAAPAHRRRERRVDDRAHRHPPRLPRRSRRLLPRLGARAPPREPGLGRDRAGLPRRSRARDVRDPLAAAAEPGRRSHSPGSSPSATPRSSSTGSTSSTGRRSST